MGSCCCCCYSGANTHRMDETEPLLTTALLSHEVKSVRHRSSKPPDVTSFDKYGYSLSHVEFTNVDTVDIVFVDRVKVFNQFLVKYFTLKDTIIEFQKLFTPKNMDLVKPQDAVVSLAMHCRGTSVTLKRTHKYCMSLSYNIDDLRQKKGSLADDLLASSISCFNAINRLIKSIMDQAPTLVDSFVLLCKDEVTVRRNIMNADLGPSREPDALKNCVENYNEMRRCHSALVKIISEIEGLCTVLLTGSQEFFE